MCRSRGAFRQRGTSAIRTRGRASRWMRSSPPARRRMSRTHTRPFSSSIASICGRRFADRNTTGLAVTRAAQVIRVAFVGASTTVDSYSVPFSHPERLEPWLNLWAAQRAPGLHFDVLNTGRTGIDSRSMAAIVRTELVPFDPDLVVFYGEANQFTPGGVLHTPLK